MQRRERAENKCKNESRKVGLAPEMKEKWREEEEECMKKGSSQWLI